MPDITAIAAGINSLKLAMDITRGLKDATITLKDAEVKYKIAELMTAIADAKVNLIDAQDENSRLQEKIKSLEIKLKQQDEVTYKDGYYYLSEPQEGKPKGPFCSNCYTQEKQLSLLTEVTNHFRRFGRYKCPSCKQKFE